jgi:hypothetical protein
VFVPRNGPRYTKEEARKAVAGSRSWAETLRKLGMCHGGGSTAVLKKYVGLWGISTEHFDPYAAIRGPARTAQPLTAVLIEHSSYSRRSLKQRLFRESIKPRNCELCGQGEEWQGKPMGLILDHINGVNNDNRLENLRIVCPNCAATLDTHCGRANRIERERNCLRCGKTFEPKRTDHRYCGPACGRRAPGSTDPRPQVRKVDRPPYARLKREIAAMGFSAVGRRYGVSDNAVRKWVRWYENEMARTGDVSEGAPPGQAA